MSDYILGPDTPLDDVAYVKQKQAAEKAAADAKAKAATQQKQKQQATETAAKAKKDARFVNPAAPIKPLLETLSDPSMAISGAVDKVLGTYFHQCAIAMSCECCVFLHHCS